MPKRKANLVLGLLFICVAGSSFTLVDDVMPWLRRTIEMVSYVAASVVVGVVIGGMAWLGLMGVLVALTDVSDRKVQAATIAAVAFGGIIFFLSLVV